MSKLLAIAGQVAAELTKLRPGEMWKVGESDDIYRLARLQCGDDPDKYLSVKYDSETEKLNVSGHRVWKNGCFYPNYESYPSDINVSAKKTPTVIARDVNNRLIEAWMPVYDAGRAKLQHYADVEIETCKRAEEIAAEFGGKVSESQPHVIDFHLPNLYVDVSMASASSVRFECRSMPLDVARAVLAALVAAAPPKRCKECESLLTGRGECMNAACDFHDMQQDAKFEKVAVSELVEGDIVKDLDSLWGKVASVSTSRNTTTLKLSPIGVVDEDTPDFIYTLPSTTKMRRYVRNPSGA
jgi:hypothetical protein